MIFTYQNLKKKNTQTFNFANLITKFAINFQNILSKLRLLGFGLCTIIIYEKNNENLENLLKKEGFKIFTIPQFEG